MLARVAGSAMRAPRVGGQPRGGGASGATASSERIDTGSVSVAVEVASATFAPRLAGRVSAVAHDGMVLQSPVRRSLSQPSCDEWPRVTACDACADIAAGAPSCAPADPCVGHGQPLLSSVSCISRRLESSAPKRRSDVIREMLARAGTRPSLWRSYSQRRGVPSGFAPPSCAGTPDIRPRVRLSSGAPRPHHPAWNTSTSTTRTPATSRRLHPRTRAPSHQRMPVTTGTPATPWRCSATGSGSRSC